MPLNARWLAEIVCGERLRMNMDDSRIIARFQSLTTGFMAAKRLGQWRPDLADELYRTWVELEQRGLKKTPEYRNVMLRADQQAWWLAELARLSSPDPAPTLSSKEIKCNRHAEHSPEGSVVTPLPQSRRVKLKASTDDQ